MAPKLERFLDGLTALGMRTFGGNAGGKIFIGHGHSPLWRELKIYISDNLHLPCEEFNLEEVAGIDISDRIFQMLDDGCFAFLIMTAEDEHSDGTKHARENVIHEVGLFQGRLGPKKAIILLEEKCERFSNLKGLSDITFPRDNISAVFHRIIAVLEREGIIQKSAVSGFKTNDASQSRPFGRKPLR